MSPRQMVADLRQWGIDTGMIAAGLRCGRTSVLNLARMDDAGGSAELVAKLERLWRRHRITSGAQDDRVATG